MPYVATKTSRHSSQRRPRPPTEKLPDRSTTPSTLGMSTTAFPKALDTNLINAGALSPILPHHRNALSTQPPSKPGMFPVVGEVTAAQVDFRLYFDGAAAVLPGQHAAGTYTGDRVPPGR